MLGVSSLRLAAEMHGLARKGGTCSVCHERLSSTMHAQLCLRGGFRLAAPCAAVMMHVQEPFLGCSLPAAPRATMAAPRYGRL